MKRIFTLLYMATILCLTSFAQASIDRLKIHFQLDSHIYVSGIADDGHRCNLIFDTGSADQLLLDTVYLREQRWHFPHLVKAKLPGAAGVSTTKVSVDSITVRMGNTVLAFPYTILYDLRSIIGCHADGLVGAGRLSKSPYEINYKSKFLRALDVVPDTVKLGYESQDIYAGKKGSKLMIQATVVVGGKRISGLYQVDTGSGGSIDFTAETTRKYHLMDLPLRKRKYTGMNVGVGDQQTSICHDMMADSIVIGNNILIQPTVTLNYNTDGAFSQNEYIGNIGADILNFFNIVVDPINNKLYYKKNDNRQPEKPTSMGLGFINRSDIGKGWIVRGLYEDSPATRANIQLGESIVSVNGKNVAEIPWEDEGFDHNKEVKLVIRNQQGIDREVHLTSEPLFP
jgi:hypothetical protein